MIRLICLDMAGTTVQDAGAVERAFDTALGAAGLTPESGAYQVARDYARTTMGRSKIEVFRAIFDGDEARADAANLAFEAAFIDAADTEGLRAIPHAADTIEKFRGAGCEVVLTTGFSPRIRDHIIDTLGWTDLVTLALSPVDAGRGRPYPDMLLTALIRTRTESVHQIAVAGDTTSDLWAGTRAGAAIVAGVRTGAHGDADFADVPHTHVIDGVADLIAVVDEHDLAAHR
ncbi:HAD family hydrolase [Mycobacterium sp. pUA109]|uniref:HAD family hydrolase n=1 Tax=Mycobacterium sp. pUA109 TaxID=3238982 RepID=UPI00351AEAE3